MGELIWRLLWTGALIGVVGWLTWASSWPGSRTEKAALWVARSGAALSVAAVALFIWTVPLA